MPVVPNEFDAEGVTDGDAVGDAVAVFVPVAESVAVVVAVADCDAVFVAVDDCVPVCVLVPVELGVAVLVAVCVADCVPVAVCDGVAVLSGVAPNSAADCGTGATPRNTVPTAAVAITILAAVDGTYRYSVVGVVAYSTNTPDSARPASE